MSKIVGNDGLTSSLLQKARVGALSHGYIIEGEKGCGKTALSAFVCQLALCDEKSACGVCKNCQKVLKNIHPDIFVIDMADNKKSIGVDQIKPLKLDAFIPPNEGEKKIYIIENGENMTGAAQNALLKILEEPPTYVMFIITALSKNLLLPVITSRCQTLTLERLKKSQVEGWLRDNFLGESSEKISLCAHMAEGNIGKGAELMVDNRFFEQCDMVMGFIGAILKKDKVKAVKFGAYLEKEKANINHILLIIEEIIFDALAKKTLKNREIKFINYEKQINYLAGKIKATRLLNILEYVSGCREKLAGNGNFALSVNVMLAQIEGEL